jgi:hypothetical protein
MPVAAKEKMAALKALEAELLRIVGEEPYRGKVVPLRPVPLDDFLPRSGP